MSSSSSDFYSDIQGGNEDSCEGGDGGVLDKLYWGTLVVAVMLLILGGTLAILVSESVITYKDPTTNTAKYLNWSLIGVGGGILLCFGGASGYKIYKNKQASVKEHQQ